MYTYDIWRCAAKDISQGDKKADSIQGGMDCPVTPTCWIFVLAPLSRGQRDNSD